MRRLFILGIFSLGALVARRVDAQACGANITANTTLTGDLDCSASLTSGLVLQAGIVLDCDGHTITGPGGAVGQQTGFYGIYVRAAGATVRNCHVKNYEVGIRVRAASNSVISNNVSEDNLRYGIEVTNSSSNVLVDTNLFQRNGLRGAHISGGSANTLVHNTFLTQAQGAQLLNTSGNFVRENTFADHGTQGLQLRTSLNNTIENNTFTNDTLHVTLASTGNTLNNNYVFDSQLLIDAASHNNTVNHMTVQRAMADAALAAYQVQDATGITVLDSEVCGNVTDHVFAATNANASFQRFFVLEPPVHVNADATSTVAMDTTGTPTRCASTVTVSVNPVLHLPIFLRLNLPVQAAILSTATFDATTVDPTSVCFGDAEDASQRSCSPILFESGRPVPKILYQLDVNGDRRRDLILSFWTNKIGVDAGDTSACLTGTTTSGQTVWGCGAVRVRP